MKLDRRLWVAIGVGVIAIAAVVLSHTVFGRPSEECRPVKDLLAFNKSQAKLIAAKTGDSDSLPTVAEEGAYQAWADGLAERAQNVSSPDLARMSTQLANLANQFVGKLSAVRVQSQSQAPGAPAPAEAYEMAALNTQITDTLGELSKACPD